MRVLVTGGGGSHRKLDASRAEERFGFRATVGLRDGLRRTIDWHNNTTTPASAAGR